jgi:polyhydroxyalkanoate synthesis regulator phasin
MPAPRTPSSASSKSSPAPKSSSAAGPTAKRSATTSKSTAAAARSDAKATVTSARNATGKTATPAKSGATKTASAGQAGVKKTARSASQGGGRSTAKQAATKSAATGTPRDLVMLTRERIQETLDEAAARGRVTRKDANELVAELVRRGRSQTEELVGDVEQLLERGREQLESATKRARKTEPVDRLVRRADRARRAAGVGPSFPILGYDDLNARQVQERLNDLRKPELRKVRDYESKHGARKSVLGSIERLLA